MKKVKLYYAIHQDGKEVRLYEFGLGKEVPNVIAFVNTNPKAKLYRMILIKKLMAY